MLRFYLYETLTLVAHEKSAKCRLLCRVLETHESALVE